MNITTTAATSGQTTRDGTEDLSAKVWQFCLAANVSTIRHPDSIQLGGAIFVQWRVENCHQYCFERLNVLVFHNLYRGEHALCEI